jgi:UPF0755 protein
LRFLLVFFVAFVFLALGLAAAFYISWSRPFKGFPENQKFVQIAKGTPSYQIARNLQREGIIRHWFWFLAYLKIVRHSAHVQAGEYIFDQPVTISQVAEKLLRGQVYYHEVTIPEGYTIFDIANLMQQKGLLTSEDFLHAASQVGILSDLVVLRGNLEGYLFPDTYRVTRGTRADEFVGMMTSNFRDVYKRILQPKLPYSLYSLNDIMTMASMVEKETAVDAERPLVAAVFYNRLKSGMPLQCDPTVIYAAKLEGEFRGKIYQTDLEIDSPYNTYRRLGLPPGPIANPGIRSIESALKPAEVDYLYFVSNNNGGHVFSRTLLEHQKAVAHYRRENNHKPGL